MTQDILISAKQYPRAVYALYKVLWEINGSDMGHQIYIGMHMLPDLPGVEAELTGVSNQDIDRLCGYMGELDPEMVGDIKAVLTEAVGLEVVFGKPGTEILMDMTLAAKLPLTEKLLIEYWNWYTGEY